MKTTFLGWRIMMGLALFLITAPAFSGGLSSGGISPPAPLAVVIQETLRVGTEADINLDVAIKKLLGEDVTEGKVIAFFKTTDGPVNDFWRVRWCIEYVNYGEFQTAGNRFKESLMTFKNAEVVSNGRCYFPR